MTSKIKVDNIENQCGGAVVTKCGGTTTISGSVVKSNAIQASDGGNLVSQSGTTITLGASGDTINLAAGASQSGFGRTGTVDWDTTPKTATFTAVSGDGFFCNTTGGAFTCNLPAGSAGAIVSVADYAGTWQTNNLTVSPNGSEKIGSVNADVALNTQGQSVTFVYVDGTQGWINTMDSTSNVRGSAFISATGGTITTSGDDKIHTFTGPGTFTVSSLSPNAANNLVSYLVVAGGGGGGGSVAGYYAGGGGGAGGYREVKTPVTPYTASPLNGYPSAPNRITVTATAFPITVGAGGGGGPGGPSGRSNGIQGSDSVFSTITSAGGGYGGRSGPASSLNGNPGGSGGGSYTCTAGSGNAPPVSPSQGNNGGNGDGPGSGPGRAGGGGGAGGAAAGTPHPSYGTAGGPGVATSITGSAVTRSGGGGGSVYAGCNQGAGGSGGGGAGGPGSPPGVGTAGTANTGGGGGGGGNGATGNGATGGSGVVIIRYKFQ